MAFIEVIGHFAEDGRIARVSERVTDELAAILDVSADTITIYYVPIRSQHYAHAGAQSATTRQRIFIKVHLLTRTTDVVRAVAAAITDVVVSELKHDPRNVAVYFLSRQLDEVAHGGTLESDRRGSVSGVAARALGNR